MEFIKFEEAADALYDVGVLARIEGDRLRLEADHEYQEQPFCHVRLADAGAGAGSATESRTVTVPRARLADAVAGMIGQLHLSQIVAFPVGKWRNVFDAVAFSLASNEHWQEVDAMATVELNTRDGLLMEPGDYHTLHALVNALMSDADSGEQGIFLTSTATSFVAEVSPLGMVNVVVGNEVLADEIMDGLKHLPHSA